MADLDDFFAKKDRKRSKTAASGKKFASTAEELNKQLEETKKNEPKQVTLSQLSARKDAADAAAANANSTPAEGSEQTAAVPAVVEDEWKEFEVEQTKDYTGLKIGQLQLDDDSESGADGEQNGADKYGDSDSDVNADGERSRRGPWSQSAGENDASAAAGVPAALPTQDARLQPLASNEKSVYVSPAMRAGALQQQMMQRAKLRKGVLPDIHDQEFFPVLGSAKPEEVKKKRPEPGFEEVRHGGRYQRPSEMQDRSAPVSIGNRFNSLADS